MTEFNADRPCMQCRHFLPVNSCNSAAGYCLRPVPRRALEQAVTGEKTRPLDRYASDERSDGGGCGPEGLCWEPRRTPRHVPEAAIALVGFTVFVFAVAGFVIGVGEAIGAL